MYAFTDQTAMIDPVSSLILMPRVDKITGLARATIYKHLEVGPISLRPIPLSDTSARDSPVGFILVAVKERERVRVALRE